MADVEFEVSNRVGRVRLNRPERRNAWTPGCNTALVDAMQRAEADPQVRSVVISGAGAGFCAGADLRHGFERRPDGIADLYGMHQRYYIPTIMAVRNCPLPVVTAVHGAAVGFGAGLALSGDFAIMAESSFLLYAFVSIGLSPDSGGTHVLPRLAGRARAAEAAMLGEPIPAARAHEWGMIHRVVPDDELETAALALAERLADGPTRTYGAVKRAFQAGEQPTMIEQLDVEGRLVQELAGTADFEEGVAAFLEKRKPQFTGR